MAKKSYSFLLLMAISTVIFPVYCSHPKPGISTFPKDVQASLIQAGSNAQELIDVIHHYSKSPPDSLKLKAAYFLIGNMEEWHYYQGEQLDHYQDYFKSVRAEEVYTGAMNRKYLGSLYGPFSYDNLRLKYDIREVTKKQLIENIDMAFKVWKEQPWGKDYSFHQFCEYILPMKMGDEMPEYNRSELYNKYNSLLDSVLKVGGDAVSACTVINDKLKEKGWYLQIGTGFLPHFPASKLIEYQAGSCRDQCDLGAYIMRSLGIPVSIDFIPQWPTRSLGHDFNVVMDKKGKPIMFGASDENPGFCRFAEVPKGKVYRRTIEKDKESLVLKRHEQEVIPTLFENPYFKDVTDEYVRSFNISVPLIKTESSTDQYKHAYICVFDNKEWVPVHWGDIRDDKVIFSKMESNIIYLPAYFDLNGITPANYPFLLKRDGQEKFLIPDAKHLISSIEVKQIFPVIPHYLQNLDGSFQGSNTLYFTKPIILFNTSKFTGLQHFWNVVSIKSNDSFRYVRYYRTWQCSIGEMEFYAAGRKLSGKAISSGPSLRENGQFSKEKAIDGDIATSFISLEKTTAWVGLDLGKAEKIDSLRFSPGISVFGPRCFVIPGHEYELRYWGKGQWISVQISVAKGASICFTNFPSNALYLVHDLTKDVNERFFIIENGKQVWY